MLATVAVVASLFLCTFMTLAGFTLGRITAENNTIPEPVTQILEITRLVTSTPETAVEESPEDSVPVAGGDTVQEAAPSPTPFPTDTLEPPASPAAAAVAGVDLDIFYEVWGVIDRQFDGEMPPSEAVLDAAIAGSLETLDDDFTRYIPPDVAARIREDMGGSVEGIGAFVNENEEGQFVIVRPIDGQPADLAGLLPGDVVVAVDGEPVADLTFDEVILKVRGPSGTEVTLTIMREGEEELLEFAIVRARFEIAVVESEMLPDNIAYVRLTEFNQNAIEKLEESLTELLAQNPRGLIFDLRDNPGGFLDQAIAVADAFLPPSTILLERNSQGLDEKFVATEGDLAETIPLVVLINAGSASASEIVAGAIQDNGRGVLIGETTFGKGSVQRVVPLSNGAELRVTIARWYTPRNSSIDEQGISPDIEVQTPDDLGSEDDPQLQRAVDYFLEQ